MIPSAWADLPFWHTDWPRIQTALLADSRVILPPEPQRFAALALTPPDKTRVVILGQDPYPTAGHAMGLAFSVTAETRPIPRSLSNVFKELQDDLNLKYVHGDLTQWARQGVLLLNTALTVPQGDAGAHGRLGWDKLAAQVIAKVSHKPTAFILWGKHAQAMAQHITPGNHLILPSAHPSPLSARRGFFGSKPFSRVNDWLQARKDLPIDWDLQP
jgi:uracil-DNA glycosylase